MELVKKIKETEAKAAEIITLAQQKSSQNKEQAVKKYHDDLSTIQKQRHEAIQVAITEAENSAKADVKNFLDEADKARAIMNEKAQGKIYKCADMVVEYINSLGEKA
jgi:vacuolar-type H+-ATPase subunit H